MGSDRPAGRPRRRVGPFSLRQVGLVGLTIVLVAVALTIATTPLVPSAGGGPAAGSGLPDPAATPYLIAKAQEGLRVGDRAPELEWTDATGATVRLTDLDGREISLAALRGRGVWLDFWASWCPPCQAETPVIRDASAAYRDRGLEIVAVSVQESSVDDVRAYVARYGLTHTVAADLGGDLFRRYRIYALPTQVFIGPDGVIRRIVQGPMSAATAAEAIEGILPPR